MKFSSITKYWHILYMINIALIFCFSECKKAEEWLDIKTNKRDVVPSTLMDFQAILDNNELNRYYPTIGLTGTDNVYIPSDNLNAVTQVERNSYLWLEDIFEGSNSSDFGGCYRYIEFANIVLDGLNEITAHGSEQEEYNNVKGQALFLRANQLYLLAQLFCKPYDASTAAIDLGLQIKLSSDPNVVLPRSTVQETYGQIIDDLIFAEQLLPHTALYTTRSSKLAANALLAKVYLSMEDYENAAIFANKTLQQYSTLLDYTSDIVNPSTTFRFPAFTKDGGNPEIIFYAEGLGYFSIIPATWGYGLVDTNLYSTYESGDLRKVLFYQDIGNGSMKFQGAYTGNENTFSGIATNEIYLIKAECEARAGNTGAALDVLNTLLEKRYQKEDFLAKYAEGSYDALSLILEERRKELPFTGQMRWEDLRRLNKDPRYAQTIVHTHQGSDYMLMPNDNRYVFPLPDIEIQLSNVPQNERSSVNR